MTTIGGPVRDTIDQMRAAVAESFGKAAPADKSTILSWARQLERSLEPVELDTLAIQAEAERRAEQRIATMTNDQVKSQIGGWMTQFAIELVRRVLDRRVDFTVSVVNRP